MRGTLGVSAGSGTSLEPGVGVKQPNSSPATVAVTYGPGSTGWWQSILDSDPEATAHQTPRPSHDRPTPVIAAKAVISDP